MKKWITVVLWVLFLLTMTSCLENGMIKYKCQKNAKYWGNYYRTKHIKYRYGRGKAWDKKENAYGPHMWCEYWTGKEWVLAKDTVGGYGGWPIESYKTGGKPDYIVDSYWEPKPVNKGE